MPSVSRSQRNFFGMVEAYKAGTLKKPKGMSPARWRALVRRLARASGGMSGEQVRHYSRTSEKGLPERARKKRRK